MLLPSIYRVIRTASLIAVASFWVFCSPPLAQDATTEPGNSSLDFRYQGEFVTPDNEASPLGIQIRSLGKGNFDGLLSTGGLPGAGWNGQVRTKVTGTLQANALKMSDGKVAQIEFSEDGLTADLKLSGRAVTLKRSHRSSSTLGQVAPANARILFDGTNLDEWTSAVIDSPKVLLPQGQTSSGGALTKRSFGDFTLHLEFRLPFLPTRLGTTRGNSGIYLQNRFELQILDSFGHVNADSVDATRHCGAFWEMDAPILNMSFPPLSWQTYDIEFTAARYDASGKTQTAMAFVTVKHNGITIHNQLKLRSRTLLGLDQGPTPLPHRLQYYGDSITYRNIWIVESTPASLKKVAPTKRSGYRLNVLKPQRFSLNQPNFLQKLSAINGRTFETISSYTPIYLATH